MNFKIRLKNLWNNIEDSFFKNHACLVCRREIPDGTKFSVCEKCFSEFEILEGNLCEICGDKILEGNRFCDRCKSLDYSFDNSRSLAVYDGGIDKIVKRLKYSGKKYCAKHIAELMFTNQTYFENIDLITFVPIGSKRRKERGFNQAEELAKEIGKLTNIEVVETLNKTGNERHQAGLSQKDRMKNLSGTFSLKDGAGEVIAKKNVLLIDDVFTTGATLSECSKVLRSDKRNKPKSVCCYTFAKTRLNSTNNGQIQQNNHEEIQTK